VEVELLHDVFTVGHRGLHADVQELGHLLVAVAFGDEFQDLLLSVGERFVRVGCLTGGRRPDLLAHRLAGHVRIQDEPAA
jgi:hypothetical protein